MTAVTSIVNKAIEGDASINLFYNTTLLNLGLQLRNGKRTGPDPEWDFSADGDSHTGFIVDQSHLASSTFEGVVLVLGITEIKGSDIDYQVSIVSPSYEPLETTQQKRTSIASTVSEDDLHVFYLYGSDDKAIKIRDFSYTTKTSFPLQDTNLIQPGSCLAAYTIGSNRFVIYQGSDNKQLYEYDVSRQQFEQIKGSTGAQENTPLAVTFRKGDKEDNDQVYLYFTIATTLEFRRIIKKGEIWGSALEVPGSTKVEKGSKIAATLANETNHVFYVPDKKSRPGDDDDGDARSTFKHLRDPVIL